MKYLILFIFLLLPVAYAEEEIKVTCVGGKVSVYLPGVVYRVTGIRCERVDGA